MAYYSFWWDQLCYIPFGSLINIAAYNTTCRLGWQNLSILYYENFFQPKSNLPIPFLEFLCYSMQRFSIKCLRDISVFEQALYTLNHIHMWHQPYVGDSILYWLNRMRYGWRGSKGGDVLTHYFCWHLWPESVDQNVLLSPGMVYDVDTGDIFRIKYGSCLQASLGH